MEESPITARNEKELYTFLISLTRNKSRWQTSIETLVTCLTSQSSKIIGKSLWLLGEIGKIFPSDVSTHMDSIAKFLKSEDNFLRERALNALGRIGRADFTLVKPYWDNIIASANDESSNVRLAFIWASENIATNNPVAYEHLIPVFERLLDDESVRVGIEAPEMFRVLGKRKPRYVWNSLDKLRVLAEKDPDRVVRIHAEGAIKVILSTSRGESFCCELTNVN